MSEIYRNSVNKAVAFSMPSTAAIVTDVTITRGEEEYDPVFTTVSGKVLVQVPFAITKYDGKFTVKFTTTVEGQPHVMEEEHEVVTPLFTKAQLVEFDSDFSTATDSQVETLERTIRSLFKTITGQTFGLTNESIAVFGTNSGMVGFPKRSAEPVGPRVGDFSNGPFALVANDGWTAEGVQSGSWIEKFEPTSTFSNKFKEGRKYIFSGLWGYKNVPSDINLAAMTLAADYGCDTSMYRERYMKSVGVADTRFTFDGRAFIKTGNVKVDQILDRYSLVRMRIL